jgi:hypothetical protein
LKMGSATEFWAWSKAEVRVAVRPATHPTEEAILGKACSSAAASVHKRCPY